LSYKLGYYRLAKSLHKLGADVNIDINREFLLCCRNGNLKMAKLLHKLGAGVKIDIQTAFSLCCRDGDLKMAMWLHKLGANINFLGGEPLIAAVSFHQPEIVKWLVTLDEMILVNVVSKFCFRQAVKYFEYSGYGAKEINFIRKIFDNELVHNIDVEIDDVMLQLIAKFNRIDQLRVLNLSYVHYDIIRDRIENFSIRHGEPKNARKL